MRFLFLDLEFNQPSKTIIQVGACIADFNSGHICEELRIYVNPEEKLSPAIIKLTGITQSQVDRGVTIVEAYERLRDLYIRHRCFSSPFTWDGDDLMILKMALKENPLLTEWPFGFRSNDVKTIYLGHAISNGLPIDGGLSKTMRRLGLTFFGKAHDALDDAKNTFFIAHYLLANKKS